MARWEPNCTITRNFAFGGKQYKKGSHAYLSGEAKDFAALKRCAVMIKTDEPDEEKSVVFSKSEGSDAAL